MLLLEVCEEQYLQLLLSWFTCTFNFFEMCYSFNTVTFITCFSIFYIDFIIVIGIVIVIIVIYCYTGKWVRVQRVRVHAIFSTRALTDTPRKEKLCAIYAQT